MYKREKVVVEDLKIGNGCLEETRYFTGGECKFNLPVTISFMGIGDYKVHIDEGKVSVEKLDRDMYD